MNMKLIICTPNSKLENVFLKTKTSSLENKPAITLVVPDSIGDPEIAFWRPHENGDPNPFNLYLINRSLLKSGSQIALRLSGTTSEQCFLCLIKLIQLRIWVNIKII